MTPEGDHTPRPSTPSLSTAQQAQRSAPVPAEAEQHVLDAIVSYNRKEDLFKVRWHGYSAADDTWEPPGHLPFNAMASYFRRLKKRNPRHLLHFGATN